jgi:hypothetical protein
LQSPKTGFSPNDRYKTKEKKGENEEKLERYGITCAGFSAFPEFDSDIVWIEKIR